MTSEANCRKCGASLTHDARDGVCPRCLLEQALASQTGEESADAPCSSVLAEGPGTVIGRYKLLEKIGEGGFGVVYMAEQEEPVRRRVALKIIKLGMDTKEIIARFEAERQALALMDHPNIAKVFDGGATETGRPYFVMDLVKGVPLTRFCDEQRLSVQERLELFIQVCQAIQHAHQKGIIHRDLKPSNVMVALYDGKPMPKVIDFGIAKAAGQPLTELTLHTRFGAMVGTLEYMSPEQAELNQLDIDTRSDIYSLGVLLYELLTGTTPLTREALQQGALEEVLRRVREEDPPSPSLCLTTNREQLPTISAQRKLEPEKLTKVVRGELDWIVMRALEKDRNRRYEMASGLAVDLQHYLNDEPVMAGPPTMGYRMKKFVRKHRAAVAVAAGFVGLLLVASAVSTELALWANRERREKEAQRQRAEDKAEAESKAKDKAKQQRQIAEARVAELKIQRAEDFFVAEDSARAVAYLADVLRRDPLNRAVAERLLSTLTFRSFGLPLTQPLQHETLPGEESVLSVQFSPDGDRVVTASGDKTARVWDVQTGKPLTAPLRHEREVSSAQFSPDGQRVVTASYDGTARVWDAQNGNPLTGPFRHGDRVYSAQFSPDGRRVVTASWDNTARVWDPQTGNRLTKPFRHGDRVYSAQFSPDGLRVVTASKDNTARVWDAQSGKQLSEALRHDWPVNSAQFSPDGLRVVTASSDHTARVWDAQTGKALTKPLRHGLSVLSAQFSPDGFRVVTACGVRGQTMGYARVWDAQTGKAITEPLRHEDGISSAQFSPDGFRVVTASWDKSAQVWDAQTGKRMCEPLRHEASVWFAQFSPDGLRLVTACCDSYTREGYAQVWDVQIGQSLTESLRHEDGISSAQFSPDGLRVATTSWDKSARVWDAQTGKQTCEPLRHEASVGFAQFSPDGLWVVTACGENTVTRSMGYAQVWDAQTGKPLTAPLRQKSKVTSARFSPDGLRVVTASNHAQRALVWDIQSNKPVYGPSGDECGTICCAQFSPDGRQVLTGRSGCSSKGRYDGGFAQIWNALTGKPLTEPLRHGGRVRCAQFSPDGLRVVTASRDHTARVWDAQTGQPLTKPLRHENDVLSAQFSPDGRWVVTASSDHTARVWDAQTGKALTEPLRHDNAVLSAQFSPDGLRVVSHSRDETARVWDAQTGQPLTEPLRHKGSVSSAQFSPNGLRVLTASWDKTARLWEMPFGSAQAPAWLAELAMSVAGKRLIGTAVLEPVATGEFLKVKQQALTSTESDYYAQWAKWFFSDRSIRTISPLSSITVPEYVQHRIKENTLESLQEAVRLSPTNGLAYARLAKLVLAQKDKDNPRRVGEVDFFSRYALKWSPNNPEVTKIRAEIKEQLQALSKP